MSERPTLYCERGGDDGPSLVLLHGQSCNGGVWDGLLPLLAEHWPGRWLVPDLRGHGRSGHGAPYGIGVYAADVAGLLTPGEEVCLIGHSMGGAVAVALATGLFGVPVRAAVVFGIKVDWSEEDRAGAAAVAQKPARLFEAREQAVERCLRVAGVHGLLGLDSRFADAGVVEVDGQFRLATDPLVNAMGNYDLPAVARAARAPIHLLTGEHDAMSTPEMMRKLGGEVTVLPGLGHNLHVEAPEAFWRAIESYLQAS
ncbi:MAG: alpha/beta hydrolase [Alphaproteobacteria bacterium]|nr:alpha/beta hydrolase [Alphaproteobacteria bacterium]MDP6814109.1 alpha/beta hydrolase [Alphaproteobacteria bacterium]